MKKYNFQDLVDFYDTNGKLPTSHKKEEVNLYNYMSREIRKGNQEIIDFCKDKKRRYYTPQDLIDFYNTNGRLPDGNKKEERNLHGYMRRERDKGNNEIIDFCKNKIQKYYTSQDLVNFYDTNGRLPTSYKKEEVNLYNYMRREIRKGNKEVIDFCKSKKRKHYSYYTPQDLVDFYTINGRLPDRRELSLYNYMSREIRKGNQKIIDLHNKQKYYFTPQDLVDFYTINGRLPNSDKKEEKNLYEYMRRERNKGNQEVIDFVNLIKSIENQVKEEV